MGAQPEWWDIQLVTAMALPAHTRAALKERAGRFLSQHWELFKDATLHVHLRPVRKGVACYIHLYSDFGVFYATAEEQTARTAVDVVLDLLDVQLRKQVEQQAERLARLATST
jgi:ribosome-associated translation inhibitor RaiA